MAHATGESVGRFERGDDPYKEEWLRITNIERGNYRVAIWGMGTVKDIEKFKDRCYYVGKKDACTSDKCGCPCHKGMALPEGLI